VKRLEPSARVKNRHPRDVRFWLPKFLLVVETHDTAPGVEFIEENGGGPGYAFERR